MDWKAVRKTYAPQAAQARSREEFAAVVNQMLGELKTSHTRYYIPDETAYYQVLGIFAPRDSEFQNPSDPTSLKAKLSTVALAFLRKPLMEKPLSAAF